MVGIRWTASTAVWAAGLGVIAWVIIDNVEGAGALPILLTALGWILAILAITCLVTVRGATARQWFVRWWRARHRILRGAWVVDSKGRAMVWDGKSARMFIELTGDPWRVSRVNSTGASDTPEIPLGDLRDVLRQYDIVLAHLRIVQYGHKVNTEDRASSAVLSVMGTLPHLLAGRTFVEISMALIDNLNAVDARQKEKDTVADGVTRSISIATDRVLRVFHTHNIRAKAVSPSTAMGIHRDIFGGVGGAAQHRGWKFLGSSGDASVGTVVSFVPSVWTPKAQMQWNEVSSLRQYNCVSLRPDGVGDTVSYAVSYLTDDPDSFQLLPTQGLRRENGRHLARVSNLLPLARDIAVDDDGGRSLLMGADPGVIVPAHPLGVYMGLNTRRDRVFVYPARGGAPLWIIGDSEYAKRLVLRTSTQRYRISVAVSGWENFVATRASRLIAFTEDPSMAAATSDIMVVTPDQSRTIEAQGGDDGPALIVVTDDFPPIDPKFSIIPIAGNQLQVTTPYGEEIVMREAPPTERAWMV